MIGYKGSIPIVSDSAIKKTEKMIKGKTYHRVSEDKLKKAKQVGEKGKKMSGYQIFNMVVRERKAKDKNFSLSMDERKGKWAHITAKIASGKIKATKKDIGAIVKSW